MVRIKKIDHVAVCVADIDAAAARYKELFGLEASCREVVLSQKTEAVLLPIGDSNIELIAPRGNDGLAKFLEKRGPGIHHIAIEVEGIESALALLKGLGVPLIDETPRAGARGHKVAFVHPKATGGVLIELVEPDSSHVAGGPVIFRQLFDRESCTLTYLIADEASKEAVLVDPVIEHVERDLAQLRDLGLTLAYVLDTHVHADHVTGAGELRRRTGARTGCAREGAAPCADLQLGAGDVVKLGSHIEVRVLATPGHTVSCLTYAMAVDGQVDRLLTGDTLLIRGCGRTDFQGGDAGTLFASVRDVLFAFPDATLVYPAHDYRGVFVSTIGEEKHQNPRLGVARTRSEFVALMSELRLPPPAKIDVAVPANRACGDVTSPRQG